MNADATLLPNGTLSHWRVGEWEVIPLVATTDRGLRGGAPVCAPIFSRVPVELRRLGLDMPIHGLVSTDTAGTVTVTEVGGITTAIHHHQHLADDQFRWSYEVVTTVTITADTLTHSIALRRRADCSTTDGMPYSYAWHPYFAVTGGDFTLSIDGWELNRASIREAHSVLYFSDTPPDAVLTPIVLETMEGTLVMEFTTPGIYDRVCVWSDDPDRYLCIEPTHGYLRFGNPGWLLAPGEERTGSVKLTATPRR